QKISSTDWLLVAIPGIIWGASFLFIAEGLKSVAPNGVTFTRIFVGFLTLALFPAARKKIDRSAWAGTALLGVLWCAFPLSMFPLADRHVPSAVTGCLTGFPPSFVRLVALLIPPKLLPNPMVFGFFLGLAEPFLLRLLPIKKGAAAPSESF